ncbi:hypothetical protein C5167_044476 [Papaver somniferum]|uniref:F-box domain-containing protein n=1 Tax=Papaver somniferum TaxID=3469 RepID=A0A4Y7LA64_PAPSO|nr:hypothetical protein C5167_044476 [Papaver somniferum]
MKRAGTFKQLIKVIVVGREFGVQIKSSRKNNIGEAEEDRISELPDSHLHYILSFLDIKHVAPTCVLS